MLQKLTAKHADCSQIDTRNELEISECWDVQVFGLSHTKR